MYILSSVSEIIPISQELRIVSAIVAILFALSVAELIRKRLLLEKFAFFWVLISLGLTLVAVAPQSLLNIFSSILGIVEISNTLFLLAILIIGAFLLRLTVHISQLNQKTTRLSQEIAILKEKVNDK